MPVDLGVKLLFDLGEILLAATLFNFLARILKQPPLLAYIVAGIFVGPLGIGSLGMSFQGIPLGVTTTEEILILSELGIAFLLFSVGIESDFSKLSKLGKLVAIGSVLQVALTALIVFAFNSVFGFLGFEQAIYLGLIVAFSSTTIVVKLLSDSYQINTLHGRLMIGFLLVQDVLVILALPLLGNISNLFTLSLIAPLIIQVLVLLAFAFVLNKYVYPKVFGFASHSDELFFLSALSSVFIFIFISYIMGFSIAVGAFIAGVTLSTLPYSTEVMHKIRGVRDFLATIFFVTLGIQITLSFASFPLGLALFIAALVFIFKPAIFYLITLLNGYGGRVSVVVALGLAQISEFSFIIASQGKAILEQTPGLYSFVILITAVSMALTPYLMSYSNAIYGALDLFVRRFAPSAKKSVLLHARISELEAVPQGLKNHVLIFGGGLVGSGIASVLHGKHNLIVVDNDSEVVWGNLQKGIKSVYGSADNEGLWRKLNIEKAEVLVIAIPRAKDAFSLVEYAKKVNPEIPVFARARYFKDSRTLYEKGADFVIMPHVIGGNVFVQKVVEYLHTGDMNGISNFQTEFMAYLRDKAKEERPRFD
ncbi:MAG: cation:proton antiporter [archaeon]